MAFTDDDLRRLKDQENIFETQYPHLKMKALLARLEAAEKVIEAYEKDAYMHKFECLRKAWRKAAGK